ncbi:MAG: hypothetical protein ACYCOR_11645 [Acidobacteriaceae bacterium]
MKILANSDLCRVSGGEGNPPPPPSPIPELPPVIVRPPPQATITIREPTQIELFLNNLAVDMLRAGCEYYVVKQGGGFMPIFVGSQACEQAAEAVNQTLLEIERNGGVDMGLTPCVDSVAGWKSPNICER